MNWSRHWNTNKFWTEMLPLSNVNQNYNVSFSKGLDMLQTGFFLPCFCFFTSLQYHCCRLCEKRKWSPTTELKQILPFSILGNLWRTMWTKCILMLGCKGLKRHFIWWYKFFCRKTVNLNWMFRIYMEGFLRDRT